jgi:hypothetical protein
MLNLDPIQAAQRYLYCADQETKIVKEKTLCRDYLKEQIRELGEPDENGNIIWYFDTPVPSGDGFCTGLMLQRRVSEYTDEEIAKEILIENDLDVRCIREEIIEVLDLDEIYVCNQEGLISDQDIDKMIGFTETWALVKVKE